MISIQSMEQTWKHYFFSKPDTIVYLYFVGRKPHYTSETTCNIYTTISHIVWKRSFQLLVFLGQSANETLVEQFVLHSTYTTRSGPQRRYSSSLGQTSPTSFQGAVVANKRRTSLSFSSSAKSMYHQNPPNIQ